VIALSRRQAFAPLSIWRSLKELKLLLPFIMLGLSGYGPRPAKTLAIVLATLFLSNPLAVQGLRTSPGSPCADTCSKLGSSSNTTTSEIACLDSQYNQTKGQDFEDCITCELESTYVDGLSSETDVDWGLCKSIDENNEVAMSLILLFQITYATHFQHVSSDFPPSSPTRPRNAQ